MTIKVKSWIGNRIAEYEDRYVAVDLPVKMAVTGEPGKFVEVMREIRLYEKDGCIEIQGDMVFEVEPRAANSIYIRFKDR